MKVYRLANVQARQSACREVMQAPDGYVVRISEPTRSLEQNAKLHALLSEVAQSEKWAGKHRDIDTWKRLLTCAWMRARGDSAEIIPAVDGHGFDVLYRRTSTLSVKEMIEFIDYIESWVATTQAERAA